MFRIYDSSFFRLQLLEVIKTALHHFALLHLLDILLLLIAWMIERTSMRNGKSALLHEALYSQNIEREWWKMSIKLLAERGPGVDRKTDQAEGTAILEWHKECNR